MKQVYIYLVFMALMLILLMLMILMSVAFLTLMERKILGYIQLRKGPNKLGFLGILQPFSDAIKLISKESIILLKFNYMYFYFAPMFMLILVLMMWMIYPFFSNLMMMKMGLFYLLCCLAFSVYMLMISGWSSNSSYSMIGSIRSLSQSISYEVSLSLIILVLLYLNESFDLLKFINKEMYMIYFLWPMALLFLFSLLAELNRTPFDFSEGESELVSGFNVEYMSGGFILIFLSEYSSILLSSYLFSMFFLGGKLFNIEFYLVIYMLLYILILTRGCLPRFRYDLLMYLCWMIILPFILNFFLLMILFKIII